MECLKITAPHEVRLIKYKTSTGEQREESQNNCPTRSEANAFRSTLKEVALIGLKITAPHEVRLIILQRMDMYLLDPTSQNNCPTRSEANLVKELKTLAELLVSK